MNTMFDWKKPTFEMVIWEWSKELLDEFVHYHSAIGQVVIMVKYDIGWDDESINFDELKCQIITDLSQKGYEHTVDYLIMHIPNIVRNSDNSDINPNQLDLFHE